jgi:hypothetical protein
MSNVRASWPGALPIRVYVVRVVAVSLAGTVHAMGRGLVIEPGSQRFPKVPVATRKYG